MTPLISPHLSTPFQHRYNPTEAELAYWLDEALTYLIGVDALPEPFTLAQSDRPLEIAITILSKVEMATINGEYRQQPEATNVLSFPAQIPPLPLLEEGALPFLIGDLLIAIEVVVEEAKEQKKPLKHHLTHMVIHGFLHLLGYDHIDDDEAEVMEQLEREILAQLAIADPYRPIY